jgi:hypothetical protein
MQTADAKKSDDAAGIRRLDNACDRRVAALRGRRLRHLEGKPVSWEALPSRSVDAAIEWGTGTETYRGRLVALYKRGRRNEKTFRVIEG